MYLDLVFLVPKLLSARNLEVTSGPNPIEIPLLEGCLPFSLTGSLQSKSIYFINNIIILTCFFYHKLICSMINK